MANYRAVSDKTAFIMSVASGLGLIVSIFNFFQPGNGIHGTPGALLVIVSTLLILAASLLFAFGFVRRRWMRVTLDVLLFLGIIGTALAAYLLEATVLLLLIAFAFIGWIIHLFALPRDARRTILAQPGEQRGLSS